MQDAAEDAFQLLTSGPCRLVDRTRIRTSLRISTRTVPRCACGERYNKSEENAACMPSFDVPDARGEISMTGILSAAEEWAPIAGHCETCMTPADREQKLCVAAVGDVVFFCAQPCETNSLGHPPCPHACGANFAADRCWSRGSPESCCMSCGPFV